MMWSDRYNYYSIKSDLQHKKKAETGSVMDVLLQTGNFVKQDHQSLCNADHFPWTSITLVEAKEGNFSSSKRQTGFINLIDIICSKEKNIDQQLYLKTFLAIAEKLNWNLYLEADDEGNENIIIERMR
ncbi:hypothetical protein H9N25_01640 [Pedobacter riviphilus]|uniref:Methyltransferase FkbM domain-containing protein n=1 Tax=Pedobacter riviphilus TaxID=2766984 RepID=A0ABX6TPN4_9SPHI|nr:hypothetical protein [Pedobacter riviphilus]QNR85230.1 hypothetical protein H9N25_01640 [Pedobacter riviphilus]